MKAAQGGQVGGVAGDHAGHLTVDHQALVDAGQRQVRIDGQVFKHVGFDAGFVGILRQPEGGPGAQGRGQLRAHLEVAVLLHEHAAAVHHP